MKNKIIAKSVNQSNAVASTASPLKQELKAGTPPQKDKVSFDDYLYTN
jgi:hypothetical protein